MPLLGDKPSFGGPGTLGVGSRWQYNSPTRDPQGIVIHSSEQSPGSVPGNDADALCAELAKPGSRPNGTGGTYGSGYHAVTDCDPVGWWRVAPDQARPNAAPPTNGTHLHVCIPTRILLPNGSQLSRATWLAEPLRTHIHVVADYIVTMSHLYSIPLVRVNQAELRLNKRGYCDHQTVSLAFGQSTHIDVGVNFPWDILASDIAALTTPIPPTPIPIPLEDDDMVPEIWHDKGFINNILYFGGDRWFGFANNDAFDRTRASVPHFLEREVPTGLIKALGPASGTIT